MNMQDIKAVDVKKLSGEELQKLLSDLNVIRDVLVSKIREVTAEQRSREARAVMDEQLAKLTPEAREALKASL